MDLGACAMVQSVKLLPAVTVSQWTLLPVLPVLLPIHLPATSPGFRVAQLWPSEPFGGANQ